MAGVTIKARVGDHACARHCIVSAIAHASHTHTHTLSLSLSLTHTHTLTHAQPPLQAYQTLRNAIVTAYRREPQRRLTVQDVLDTVEGYEPDLKAR